MSVPMLRRPFFEIGIKNYLYGDDVLELAKAADEAARRYDVDVLFIPPMIDLRRVCDASERLIVLAPYMDLAAPGRGVGKALPEGIKAAGAAGAMLNHAERPIPIGELSELILRARELDLLSFVCTGSIEESVAVAALGPDVINPEPADRIGTDLGVPADFVRQSTDAVRAVSSQILVEQAAGITRPEEVADLVRAGADGVGVASGIAAAANPSAVAVAMIRALAEASAGRVLEATTSPTQSGDNQ